MALTEDTDTLSTYLNDFGVSCKSGTVTANAIFEQPDLVLAGDRIVSTDYQLTAKTSDFGTLVGGASITIDNVAYTVREVRKIDDGSFCEISVSKT